MSTALSTTTVTGFGLLVSPATLEAAKEVAAMLSKSELVPKAFQNKPNDILIAGAMGARLGLDLFSALSGIAVVNGRPTLWGDAQLAVCQARPDFAGMEVAWSGQGESLACSVTVHRSGHASPYVGEFGMADAKRAGLAGKQGPWTNYPRRMMELRARAFALRSAFADALSGYHAREEFEGEEIDVTATSTVHTPEPKPAKRRTAPAADEQEAAAAPRSEPAPAPEPAKAEPTPAAGEEPKPSAPKTKTQEALDKANLIYEEHRNAALPEFRKIADALGVKNLGEGLNEQNAPEALRMLATAERALAEGGAK